MTATKESVITPELLEKWDACSDGKKWGLSVIGEGMSLKDLLPKFERSDWMLWTLGKTGALTKVQYVELAVISAQSVLHIYENKYPKDDRPRKAIEAAIAYVKNPTEANRKAAAAAAADAAYDAYAADAAYAAAYAADAYAADAYAAYAAAYAADAYAAYAADAYAARVTARKTHHKLLCVAIRKKLGEWNVL